MGIEQRLTEQLDQIRRDALYKEERIIAGPQDARIRLASGQEVLNFCANNYLGLANHPEIIAAAKQALDDHGFGLASVRFICGTQDLHKELEARIAAFFGTEDAILYAACFDANGGLFETLTSYVKGIVTFDASAAALVVDVPLTYKLHILLGFTLFLVSPFTRMIHIWSGAGALVYLFRPYQIVRTPKTRAKEPVRS